MSTDATGAAAPGIGIHNGHGQAHHDAHAHAHADSVDTSSIAVVNPPPPDAQEVQVQVDVDTHPNPKPSATTTATTNKSTGLHSPPDSNNVDGSTDSELSDFDEAIANADDMKLDSPEASTAAASDPDPAEAPAAASAATTAGAEAGPGQPEQAATPEQDEDIGEVLPDHWSGTVPVFKPTMQQFKDFKKFVCLPRQAGPRNVLSHILTCDPTDGSGRFLWHEVGHNKDHSS